MGRLELSFLGRPEVRHAGRKVSFRTRKTLALLAYLAIEGRLHPREKLTALLWPDSDDSQARGSLRNTLAYLRQALDDGGPGHLVVERYDLGFDFASDFELDLLRLTHTAHDIGRRPAAELRSALEDAAALSHADLLEGLALPDAPAFEEWLATERARVRGLTGEVLRHLSDVQRATGDQRAVSTAVRRVALDPFDEQARTALMEAHLSFGDRRAAIATFEQFRALLRAELKLEPSATTCALAELARRLDSRPRLVRTSDPPDVPELPLVGRASEHAWLAAQFQAAAPGRPSAVFLDGEAGIGKSRLATDFLEWTAARGANTLRGRSFESGGRLPYGPVIDALRRRLQSPRDSAARLGELGPAWVSELSLILPELGTASARAPEVFTAVRLFEAVTRLFLVLAARAPVVFLVDDLQWADSGSLDLLEYLARRIAEERAPVLLVFAVRTDALASPQLSSWRAALAGTLPVSRLELGPVTLPDLQALLALVAPSAPTSEAAHLAGWLYRETGGHPLYVTETLLDLAERQVLHPAGQDLRLDLRALPQDGTIAPGVRETIRGRIGRLDRDAVALLQAAAVLGHPDFRTLHEVARLNDEAALTALETLLGARLLNELPAAAGGHGLLAFSHDRVREVVYTELSEARRELLHGRALSVLETRRVSAAILAYHARGARQPAQALQHHMQAGHDAAAIYAWQEARTQYEQAWQLVLTGSDSLADDQQAGEVHERLFGAAYTLSELEQARQAAQDLLKFARQRGREVLVCLALNSLARWHMDAGTLDLIRAGAYLNEALELCGRLGQAEARVRTELHVAQLELLRWERHAALERAEGVLPLATTLGDVWRQGCLWMIAQARAFLGDWDTAQSLFSTSRAFSAPGLRLGAAYSRLWAGMCALNAGQLEVALQALQEAYEAHVRCGAPAAQQLLGAVWLAHALLEADRPGEAATLLETARTLASEPAVSPALRLEFCIARSALHTTHVEQEGARQALHEGVQHIRQLDESGHAVLARLYSGYLASLRCGVEARTGHWEAAADQARDAVRLREALQDEHGFHAPRLPLWLEVEALVRAGEGTLADAALSRLMNMKPSGALRVASLRACAARARLGGNERAAAPLMHEAHNLAVSLGLRRAARETGGHTPPAPPG